MDRDPFVFRYILNYLRAVDIDVDLLSKAEKAHLLADAKFYKITGTVIAIC